MPGSRERPSPQPSRDGERAPARVARKPFLLRIDPALHEVLERWAADELRSLNGQIEFLLADAVRRAGRDRRR
jgi:hypothetical protein